eukprot:Partr_v1_DN25772_c0_g1_i3_m74565 putative N(alpha)-acetyltransferase 40, NatD catalytic subunit, homolog (S. cerevisiae)
MMDLRNVDLSEFCRLSLLHLESPSEHAQFIYGKWIDLDAAVTIQLFDLVRDNMRDMYSNSSWGWNKRKKLDEMRMRGMWYVVHVDKSMERRVNAFVSFQLCDEPRLDDRLKWECVYCYELQVSPASQRQGLGRRLMDIMEYIGVSAGREYAILTVFTANTSALDFYRARQYEPAETSPSECFSHAEGDTREDYEILIKQIQ